MAARYRNVPPRASAMIEALRGLGYSPATAIADIVDNSIAAGATKVDLQFYWKGSTSGVGILDDGGGMTDEELERAMRLGDKSPLADRSPHDLGRFGLGLKTASFSQCRRLTVATLKNGETACLHWDLDVLAESEDQQWLLLEGPPEGLEWLLNGRREGSWTLVYWDKLDRIVTPGFNEQDFLDAMDVIEQHLAMVFHRYIGGTAPRLRLTMNGRPVEPWDPFLSFHTSTWTSSLVQIPSGAGPIGVQCHVLPHKDRLSEAEHKSAAGPDGWTAQQGFYVYRNQRLLLAGSWLGLGQGRSWTKEEAHRLARIRIDIPNTADTDWKIDIRKSVARPPVSIRQHLTKLAEDTRARARRVFAHRSQPVRSTDGKPVSQVWRADHLADGMRYRIDQSHPVVRGVLDEAGSLGNQINAMLRVIEETVPVQRIWLDTTENRETPRTGFAGAAPAEVNAVLQVMFRNLVERKALSVDLAVEQLLHTEPFQNYPDLVLALADQPSGK